MPVPPRVLHTLLGALMLGACAAEPLAGPGPLRVLVRLAKPLGDGASIGAAAAAAAGRPVRYLAASGADWHALAIDCSTPADCSAAFERLRADTTRFGAVQVDARKRIVAPDY